jgi:glycosyltransferase involved in cell wall biosynthesis
MNKPHKIAVYSGEIPSTTFIERLVDGISKRGVKVYLFGLQKKKKPYSHPNICEVSHTENSFNKFFNLLKYSILLFFFRNKEKRKLDAFIKNHCTNHRRARLKFYPVLYHRPDIFHIQWAKSISDWMWVQEFGIKLVLSLRGAHINYSPIADPELAQTYRNYFPRLDGFHAVSEAIAREAQHYGADPQKIQVVYSGLTDLDAVFDKKPKNEVFEILSVGRSHWKKGYDYALQAMQLLGDKKIDFNYTLIGGKGAEELEFLKADLGLQDRVQLLGNMPFEIVQQKMFQADVLLLSSVEEGIANVVLEAMQLGTLVLSTDCGGMREVIQDGKNGFIVPVRDPQSMAAALQKIYVLADSQKEDIRVAAQATIQQNHTLEKMVHDMCSLYEQVL